MVVNKRCGDSPDGKTEQIIKFAQKKLWTIWFLKKNNYERK